MEVLHSYAYWQRSIFQQAKVGRFRKSVDKHDLCGVFEMIQPINTLLLMTNHTLN